MKRRESREAAFSALFAASFHEEPVCELPAPDGAPPEATAALDEFGQGLVDSFGEHSENVDHLIEKNLKGWRVERLPRVSLSILRLAITEMLYGEPDMHSVTINEAVELAKKYGGDNDYQFINGVLGSVSRETGAQGIEGAASAGGEAAEEVH